jgi:hypothetical protein
MTIINTQRIHDELDLVMDRYNGDNDIIPGAPVVTWADAQLAYILGLLLKKVEELEGSSGLPDSIKDALNSGDGVYRP